MANLEKEFKDEVRKELNRIPELFYMIKEALGLRGYPDIFICYKGKFVAWELKRSKDFKQSKQVPLQEYTLERIRRSGGYAAFVYPENLQSELNKLLCMT